MIFNSHFPLLFRTEDTASKISGPPVSSLSGGSANVQSATQKRTKRLARSRIPTKPVEMPGGVDMLDLEVCFYSDVT